jgi:hypothetical protein
MNVGFCCSQDQLSLLRTDVMTDLCHSLEERLTRFREYWIAFCIRYEGSAG